MILDLPPPKESWRVLTAEEIEHAAHLRLKRYEYLVLVFLYLYFEKLQLILTFDLIRLQLIPVPNGEWTRGPIPIPLPNRGETCPSIYQDSDNPELTINRRKRERV